LLISKTFYIPYLYTETTLETKLVGLSTRFILLLMEAKCDASKFKQQEKIGLTLPHKTFAVFTYTAIIHDT